METRKALVCANFKLNLNRSETETYICSLAQHIQTHSDVDVWVAPVLTTACRAVEKAEGSSIHIGVQNVFYETKGAFTGEYSAEHIKELGCTFAIVGHSERRRYFAETDVDVERKVRACLNAHMVPIACVGETLEERNDAKVKQVLTKQLQAIVKGCAETLSVIPVIAYEPVWAIGTGKTATLDTITEAHGFIREFLQEEMGSIGAQIRILYGGSVTPENCVEIFSLKEVDGALVGGASLDVQKFYTIVSALENRKVLV